MNDAKAGSEADRYIGLQALLVGLFAVLVGFILDHSGHGDISTASSLIVGTTGGLVLLRKGMIRSIYLWIAVIALTGVNIAALVAVHPLPNFNVMYAAPVFMAEILLLLYATRGNAKQD